MKTSTQRSFSKRKSHGKHQRGFTLIEMMIVLTIMGILVSIALPSMASLVRSTRIQATTSLMMSSMRLARSESFRRGTRVALCRSADGNVCSASGGWEQGWIVFVDSNGSGEKEYLEPVLQRVEAQADLRVTGNMNVSRYIAYTTGGTARTGTGAMLAGTITICQTSLEKTDATQIVISAGGRARTQKATVDQCA